MMSFHDFVVPLDIALAFTPRRVRMEGYTSAALDLDVKGLELCQNDLL